MDPKDKLNVTLMISEKDNKWSTNKITNDYALQMMAKLIKPQMIFVTQMIFATQMIPKEDTANDPLEKSGMALTKNDCKTADVCGFLWFIGLNFSGHNHLPS